VKRMEILRRIEDQEEMSIIVQGSEWGLNNRRATKIEQSRLCSFYEQSESYVKVV